MGQVRSPTSSATKLNTDPPYRFPDAERSMIMVECGFCVISIPILTILLFLCSYIVHTPLLCLSTQSLIPSTEVSKLSISLHNHFILARIAISRILQQVRYCHVKYSPRSPSAVRLSSRISCNTHFLQCLKQKQDPNRGNVNHIHGDRSVFQITNSNVLPQ
jgi:hypothetical protein